MNTPTLTADDLRHILSGDVAHLPKLLNQEQEAIIKAAEAIDPESRTLTASAVRRILLAYSRQEIEAGEAQRWASFVRRGYVASTRNPVAPVEIHFEAENEDMIVDALSRLDELGEVVDGSIDEIELQELIDSLSSAQ